jgi:hypothetical protein
MILFGEILDSAFTVPNHALLDVGGKVTPRSDTTQQISAATQHSNTQKYEKTACNGTR